MEEWPPIWSVVANTLNKQSRTGGGPPTWGLGEVLTTHRKNICYGPFTKKA